VSLRFGSRRSVALSIALGAALPLVWLGGCSRCQKDQDPVPLPAQPDASSEPTVLAVDAGPDADADAADADADAKKKPSGPGPTAAMRKCCNALAQNAENAPEPTKTYMKLAAASCHAGVAQGKDKASIIAIVTGALRGAGLPAECK
jgi:hypothetical protein